MPLMNPQLRIEIREAVMFFSQGQRPFVHYCAELGGRLTVSHMPRREYLKFRAYFFFFFF